MNLEEQENMPNRAKWFFALAIGFLSVWISMNYLADPLFGILVELFGGDAEVSMGQAIGFSFVIMFSLAFLTGMAVTGFLGRYKLWESFELGLFLSVVSLLVFAFMNGTFEVLQVAVVALSGVVILIGFLFGGWVSGVLMKVSRSVAMVIAFVLIVGALGVVIYDFLLGENDSDEQGFVIPHSN